MFHDAYCHKWVIVSIFSSREPIGQNHGWVLSLFGTRKNVPKFHRSKCYNIFFKVFESLRLLDLLELLSIIHTNNKYSNWIEAHFWATSIRVKWIWLEAGEYHWTYFCRNIQISSKYIYNTCYRHGKNIFETFYQLPYTLNSKTRPIIWKTIFYFKSYKGHVKVYPNPRRAPLLQNPGNGRESASWKWAQMVTNPHKCPSNRLNPWN